MQENHYYPFGLELAGIRKVNKLEHKFTCNGKEKQEEFGLNWLDYGARNYDASLGRWFGVDEKAEKYYPMSPYAYVVNNPLKFIDPNGKEIKPVKVNEYTDKNGVKHITIRFDFKGKIINNSSGNIRAKDVASNVRSRLTKAFAGSVKIGNVVYNFKPGTIDVRGVNRMNDVNDDDHLSVIVDNITEFARDKNDVVLPAGGLGKLGAIINYVSSNDVSFTGEKIVHELGHNFRLYHNWEASPKDASGDNNYMSYASRKRTKFSPTQLYSIYMNRKRLNQGRNSKRATQNELRNGKRSSEKKPNNREEYKGQKMPVNIDESGN